MVNRNTGLIKRLTDKNIRDTIILGLVTILLVGVIIFIEDKVVSINITVFTLLFFFIQSQFARNDLIKSIDKLIDNELNEFQKISVKVLNLSEKQRLLTHKYTEMMDDVMQTTKSFKTSANLSKEKTQNISLKVEEVFEISNKEYKSLNSNINTLQNLKQKIQTITELIIELTDNIKQIGSTVYIVENISEQTNMLALNAAVEAARAGEYGKGFAVVAGEIRKLADEAKQATNKITGLVSEIEQTANLTINAAEDGSKEAESGVNSTAEVIEIFSSIIEEIRNLVTDLSDIYSSSVEQQALTNDVLEVINNMKQSISNTISTMEENIQNIKEFSEISINIKDNIAN